MTALTHITAGRTAIRALLIAAVLTAGIAGTVGTAAAEPIDGKGNDVLTSLDGKGNDVLTSLDGKGNDVLTSLDGKGNDVLTSLDGKGNDVLTSLDGKGNDVLTSLDGKGNDVVTNRFPINTFTVSVDSDYAGRGGGSGKPNIQ